MLKLDLSTDPRWLDLAPGVRVRLLPLTTALMVTTRNDPSIAALPEDASNEDRALVFAKALGRRAVVEWEGVGDMDGNVLDLTPEGVDALLDIYPIFEAFQAGYVAKALVLDQEKKRLRALADWHFSGGDRYCEACESLEAYEARGACKVPCPECPQKMNRPQTFEGAQVWDLVGRLGGQLRASQQTILGWDMGAALAMAQALGVNGLAAMEMLPEIEAVMVKRVNERIGDQHE